MDTRRSKLQRFNHFGPYAEPDENLVHPSKQADVFRGAHYCASCHFGKVKDVMREDIPAKF